MVFELSPFKIIVLGVVALLVFGPERLPAMAAQAGRMLRELRRMAEGAKAELQDSLPSELSDFDVRDLNPRHFVRKHLVDELTGDGVLLGRAADGGNGTGQGQPQWTAAAANGHPAQPGLRPGESPPYDIEAT
jgi:sec-independent protein translocase protein TatB